MTIDSNMKNVLRIFFIQWYLWSKYFTEYSAVSDWASIKFILAKFRKPDPEVINCSLTDTRLTSKYWVLSPSLKIVSPQVQEGIAAGYTFFYHSKTKLLDI